MDEDFLPYKEPKYTMRWLVLHILYAFGMSLLLALIAGGIRNLAEARSAEHLLSSETFQHISDTTIYCFAIVAITLVSLMLVELAFRKEITYIQYTLVSFALTLFYLLLVAMSEFMWFWLAYVIVTVMTIGLITWFTKGIFNIVKAAKIVAIILGVEYCLLFILSMLGSTALLVGSLTLFVIIAVAMYFTLKLKKEDEELVLK